MVGIVVVSHGLVGKEMVRVAQSIVKNGRRIEAVALEHDEDMALIQEKISNAIKLVDQNAGVLLLTDMFGGTPSNLCLSFLKENEVDVISGFNLPMLIKLSSMTQDEGLYHLGTFIREYGQKNITQAIEVLKGNPRV